MPFLAPLIPAVIGAASTAGTAASAIGGIAAGANAIGNALKGSPQAATPQLTQSVNDQQVREANQDAYTAQSQQQQLANQLAAQGGIKNQSDVYAQQQALAGQLGQMAQGQGPSPAQAQLAQATGANVANQAALMAGQRGASGNVGLMARQAGQAGSAAQQQAAGQGAALKAQEQLNAIGALQNQQGMLGNLATTQVGQQTGAIGNLNQFAQNRANSLMGAQQAQNQQNIAVAGQQTDMAKQQGQQQFQQQQGLIGGTGAALGALGKSFPQQKAEGGMIEAIGKENYKGRSRIGAHLMAKGGDVKVMEHGGHVPGKAEVGGAVDSYANDKVKALLSPGEIVLPRSVTQSADPVEAAARFVAALQAKRGKK